MIEALPSLPVRLEAPFTAEDLEPRRVAVYEHRGLLRAEGDTLVLETRPVGSRGAGAVEARRIGLGDVSAVEWSPGWVRSRLVLRPRRLAAFEGLPGRSGDDLVLRVARADRDLASRWATALSLALLERDAE